MPEIKRKRINTPIFLSDPIEGPEWPIPKRTHVKQMKKLKYSGNEIKQKTGVSRNTQYIIYETTNHRFDKERSDRSLKFDQKIIHKMIKALQERYNQRKKLWDFIVEEFIRAFSIYSQLKFGLSLNEKTIRRYMNKIEYHKCRAYQKSWISKKQIKNRLH